MGHLARPCASQPAAGQGDKLESWEGAPDSRRQPKKKRDAKKWTPCWPHLQAVGVIYGGNCKKDCSYVARKLTANRTVGVFHTRSSCRGAGGEARKRRFQRRSPTRGLPDEPTREVTGGS